MTYTNPTVDDFKAYFVRDFPYSSDIATGVTDNDIAKAINEAGVVTNQNLWDNQNTWTMGYLLLTAHYLVMDLRAASQGIAGTYSWITTSKAVGNVSEGFQVPQRIIDNPEFAMLSKTYYGAKYLNLLLPQLAGQVFPVAGRTLA